MYNLARHPDYQERAFQEILDVLQDKVYIFAVVPFSEAAWTSLMNLLLTLGICKMV